MADKQKLKIDREAVKTLAIAVGVREAARQLGLNEERVMKWSQRDHWLKQEPKPQPPTVTRNEVRTVRNPSDALATMLLEDNTETKLGLSRYARKQAKELSERGKLKDHHAFRNITAGASQLHGWEETKGKSNIEFKILNAGGNMSLTLNETSDD